MKRTLIVLLFVVIPFSLLALRPRPCKTRAECFYRFAGSETATATVTATITATQTESVHAQAEAREESCSPDWSLPFTAENTYKILNCLHHPRDLNETLCPPPGSVWEGFFNTSVCWFKNHPQPTPTFAVPATETPGTGYP